jgi:chorismate synthase
MDENILDDEILVSDDMESTETVSEEIQTVDYEVLHQDALTIVDRLDVIVIVVMVWFASWLLRSWRTRLVKVR